MYAMQGTMSVGAFMRSLGSAKAPWLTVDAAAESRRQEHCGETGRFLSGAVEDSQHEPQERIDTCMNCPYPECRNCWEQARDRKRKRKQSARELADSLRLRRCGEV
jgi:hypothetical protein|nr:MAG TPA: hypothetical protein [Caudoviricetes sp.]